jgi:hypothetical protein
MAAFLRNFHVREAEEIDQARRCCLTEWYEERRCR